jgi:hypothetical protein
VRLSVVCVPTLYHGPHSNVHGMILLLGLTTPVPDTVTAQSLH